MRKQTIGFAFPFRAVYGDTAQRKTYGRKIMNKGYIYIMTNPSFKDIEKDLGFVPEWQPLEEKDASRIYTR